MMPGTVTTDDDGTPATPRRKRRGARELEGAQGLFWAGAARVSSSGGASRPLSRGPADTRPAASDRSLAPPCRRTPRRAVSRATPPLERLPDHFSPGPRTRPPPASDGPPHPTSGAPARLRRPATSLCARHIIATVPRPSQAAPGSERRDGAGGHAGHLQGPLDARRGGPRSPRDDLSGRQFSGAAGEAAAGRGA